MNAGLVDLFKERTGSRITALLYHKQPRGAYLGFAELDLEPDEVGRIATSLVLPVLSSGAVPPAYQDRVRKAGALTADFCHATVLVKVRGGEDGVSLVPTTTDAPACRHIDNARFGVILEHPVSDEEF